MEPAGKYTVFYGKKNENHKLSTGLFVPNRIISAVKRADFRSDRCNYIILRGRWCYIIFLNVHASTEDKIDNVNDSFNDGLKCVLNTFHK
jgi:hypothetical protein